MTRISAAAQEVQSLPTQNANEYCVRSGDTLSEIAQAQGVSLEALIQANPQISNPNLIHPDQVITIPSGGGGQTYTVQEGDTLSGIAARFGTDWQTLARQNGLDNPHLIYPNQQIHIGGGDGQVGGPDGTGGPEGTPGDGTSNVYDVARQYLGRNASDLKTDTSDDLPMNPNVPNNVCCANFVSGVLIEAGVMDSSLRTDSVAQLNTNLRNAGWTAVDPSQAKPGDVVIIQGGGVSHTEIYAGNGRMIGSNNVNADGSQRISENNLSWALDHGAVILRAPGGANNGSAPAEGTNGADGAAPTGEGTRQQRIDQAIAYFEGQGWTRAQAVGIVANLDAESGMDPNINQIGGGPGYGLAQWEAPRQADFRAWAGKDIRQSTFAEQLQFIQWELNNTEAAAGRALRGADDPGEAASIVTRRYERPADSAGEAVRRADRARDIWNR
ncbi:phage tail tip lysozyme [Sphingomonas sp. MS122]|uniref:phage tail tip lysozyme n=1 Tax=Sphingomonas sp. MS122 TaxID=3412683 RepID=UPI003C2EEAC3